MRLNSYGLFVAGVLVAGIGGATKVLQQFISCRKSYEAVALFGCSTDTYDAEGKILDRAPHQHITKEAVEEALCTFRGDIMQKPPMYTLPPTLSILGLRCAIALDLRISN